MGAAALGTKLGRYQIVKHLASGGMAEVLLAKASGIEGFTRHVVIKRIRPSQATDASFVQMFLNEARLAAQLHHHHIVQVHDIGQEGNEYFFAMEYVHGEDLRRLLTHLARHKQKLPLEHVVTIITAAATALHHAHEQLGPDRKPLGIVHRDVTPANILVGYDGSIKVADFGIAKAALRTAEVTQAGTLKGKASYMSPEQCTGSATLDRRSDVFALGIVLYELATTRRLFKAESDFLTMSAIVSGKIPSPREQRPDMPIALEAIIVKALAQDPAKRFQTADEMRLALDAFATHAQLRTTTSGLAGYMKQQFGEKPEPWLVEAPADAANAAPTVDFDGSASGVAAAPQQSIDNLDLPPAVTVSNDAPILRARTKAISVAPPMKKPLPPVTPVVAPIPAKPRAMTAQIPAREEAAAVATDKPKFTRRETPVPLAPQAAARQRTITVQIPAAAQAATAPPPASKSGPPSESSGVPLPGVAKYEDSAATAVTGVPKDVDDAWDTSQSLPVIAAASSVAAAPKTTTTSKPTNASTASATNAAATASAAKSTSAAASTTSAKSVAASAADTSKPAVSRTMTAPLGSPVRTSTNETAASNQAKAGGGVMGGDGKTNGGATPGGASTGSAMASRSATPAKGIGAPTVSSATNVGAAKTAAATMGVSAPSAATSASAASGVNAATTAAGVRAATAPGVGAATGVTAATAVTGGTAATAATGVGVAKANSVAPANSAASGAASPSRSATPGKGVTSAATSIPSTAATPAKGVGVANVSRPTSGSALPTAANTAAPSAVGASSSSSAPSALPRAATPAKGVDANAAPPAKGIDASAAPRTATPAKGVDSNAAPRTATPAKGIDSSAATPAKGVDSNAAPRTATPAKGIDSSTPPRSIATDAAPRPATPAKGIEASAPRPATPAKGIEPSAPRPATPATDIAASAAPRTATPAKGIDSNTAPRPATPAKGIDSNTAPRTATPAKGIDSSAAPPATPSARTATDAPIETRIPTSAKTPSGGWSPAKLLAPAEGATRVPASPKTPSGGWAPAKLLANDPPLAPVLPAPVLPAPVLPAPVLPAPVLPAPVLPALDTSSGVVVDDASDEESAPTRVDEPAPSASTVAAIAASIDIDESPSTVTAVAYESPSTVTAVAYDEPMSTYAANGDEGASTVNARPIRVPSESGYDSPVAAADASADVDFDEPETRESAPALPPPPAEHGGAFNSRASTNNDDVTGVDMPFGGRAQSNVSTIFGDPAGAMTYPPNTWPTGSRLVQTPPGFIAKLLASPKRIAIIGGSAAVCLILMYFVAFRGNSKPTATPAPTPALTPTAPQQPAIQEPPAPPPTPPPPIIDEPAGSAAVVETPPPPPPPPPVTRPKTVVVKKPAAVTTKPAIKKPTTIKKPATTTTTPKPKKPTWDPNSLFPTKRK